MLAELLADFHLLRPLWLLALIPMILFIIWHYRSHGNENPWHKVIDAHLLNHLLVAQNKIKSSSKWFRLALILSAVLSILALSGPTFQKRPLPVFETEISKIVLLDLSMSMLSEDVAPSRLERAKFKINDLLQQTNEGSIALIVYAGDAFVISPLTTDARTIATLIPPLSPTLMPVLGSQPVTAFALADELFTNSGVFSGQIIWITDGIDDNDFNALTEKLNGLTHQVSILAVGTADGAPIPMPDGQGFLKDGAGQIVVPKLNYSSLEDIAGVAKGNISPLTPGDEDLTFLMNQLRQPQEFIATEDDLELDTWIEFGPWLLLPVVLFLSLTFRKGFIFSFLLVGILIQPAKTVSAAEGDTNTTNQDAPALPRTQSFWESLWLTPDQQAQRAFQTQQHQQAADLFKNPAWKSAALYRSGQYEASLFANKEGATADDWYNRGNALAYAGDLESSIAAYEEALKLFPEMPDALHNKKIVEDLLQQQQEQEQQNQDQDSDSDEQQEQQDEQQEEQNNENQENENQDQQQQQEQQQQQQQQQQEQEMKELEEMSEEEKQQVLEQWLRQIKDDPGGLLRRKMYMEYQKRQQQNKKLQKQGEKVW